MAFYLTDTGMHRSVGIYKEEAGQLIWESLGSPNTSYFKEKNQELSIFNIV